MSRFAAVMSSVAMLILVCAPAMAGKARPKTRQRAKPTKRATTAGPGTARKVAMPTEIPPVQISLADWPATMAGQVELTEGQTERLKAKIAVAKEALAAYHKESDPKLTAAKGALDDARRAYNADEVTKAAQKVKELEAAGERFEAAQHAEVLSVLTSGQRDRWEGYRLYCGLLASFMEVDLTADQEKQMRALADQAAGEIAKTEGEETKAAVRKKLLQSVAAGVLTDGQKRMLGGEPAAGSGRKKAKSAGEKKRGVAGPKRKSRKGDKAKGTSDAKIELPTLE